MKCPRCWTEKAYVRPVGRAKSTLLSCLMLVPMKCRHCYHTFTILWFFTIGKQVNPPVLRIAPISREAGPTLAARHFAATRQRALGPLPTEQKPRGRADAA
jgi:hypothetical protein